MLTRRSPISVFVAMAFVTVALTAGSAGASVLGEIWQNVPLSGGDASIVPAGPADAMFYTNAIDYNSNLTGYTPAGFLKNPAFFNTSALWNPNASFNNSFLRFTGMTYLDAGANDFVVPHDDGVVLTIDNIGVVLNQPGPTSPVYTPFTVMAPTAGLYGFTLQYGECCGAPAVLGFQVNDAPVGPIPEPASIALLGIGLVGFLTCRRWKRRV